MVFPQNFYAEYNFASLKDAYNNPRGNSSNQTSTYIISNAYKSARPQRYFVIMNGMNRKRFQDTNTSIKTIILEYLLDFSPVFFSGFSDKHVVFFSISKTSFRFFIQSQSRAPDFYKPSKTKILSAANRFSCLSLLTSRNFHTF